MTHTAVDLDLSAAQARRLMNGAGILLKHVQIGEGRRFHLPAHIVKKLHGARRRRKGMRLALSHEDREENGGSIASFFRSKVLPVYQSKVAPVVRQGLKDVANAAAGALGESLGGPAGAMLAAQAAPLINQGVNYVGDTTGGFGLRGRRRRTFHHMEAPSHGHRLLNPALISSIPNLPDFSRPDFKFSGISSRELVPRMGRRKALRGEVTGGSFLTG